MAVKNETHREKEDLKFSYPIFLVGGRASALSQMIGKIFTDRIVTYEPFNMQAGLSLMKEYPLYQRLSIQVNSEDEYHPQDVVIVRPKDAVSFTARVATFKILKALIDILGAVNFKQRDLLLREGTLGKPVEEFALIARDTTTTLFDGVSTNLIFKPRNHQEAEGQATQVSCGTSLIVTSLASLHARFLDRQPEDLAQMLTDFYRVFIQERVFDWEHNIKGEPYSYGNAGVSLYLKITSQALAVRMATAAFPNGGYALVPGGTDFDHVDVQQAMMCHVNEDRHTYINNYTLWSNGYTPDDLLSGGSWVAYTGLTETQSQEVQIVRMGGIVGLPSLIQDLDNVAVWDERIHGKPFVY